jgi:hypothetical protein
MFSSNVWEIEIYFSAQVYSPQAGKKSRDPDSLWISLAIDYLGREVLNVDLDGY